MGAGPPHLRPPPRRPRCRDRRRRAWRIPVAGVSDHLSHPKGGGGEGRTVGGRASPQAEGEGDLAQWSERQHHKRLWRRLQFGIPYDAPYFPSAYRRRYPDRLSAKYAESRQPNRIQNSPTWEPTEPPIVCRKGNEMTEQKRLDCPQDSGLVVTERRRYHCDTEKREGRGPRPPDRCRTGDQSGQAGDCAECPDQHVRTEAGKDFIKVGKRVPTKPMRCPSFVRRASP